jgi:hypothetical protein
MTKLLQFSINLSVSPAIICAGISLFAKRS